LSVIAIATGGNGNTGYHSGNAGGTAGTATASANGIATNGANLNVAAYQHGGSGGAGYYGASGASGADSIMNNAVSGSTSGSLTLTQNAYGGTSGYSDSGTAVKGGLGSSSLSVLDYIASYLSVNVLGQGGNGGQFNSDNGGDGNATAAISIASSGTTTASATGGNGDIGGNATAVANGITFAKAGNTLSVGAFAYGGEGAAPIGGAGGTATASASGIATNGADISVAAAQYGGNGGLGYMSPGGNGANSIMNNSVSGFSSAEK